jgi:hypothetical protein
VRRFERINFPVVESSNTTVGHPDDHVPTAAKVPGFRVGDCKRKSGRNCSVDGVATRAHYLHARSGSDRAVARDNGVAGKRRLGTGRVTPSSWKYGRYSCGNRQITDR